MARNPPIDAEAIREFVERAGLTIDSAQDLIHRAESAGGFAVVPTNADVRILTSCAAACAELAVKMLIRQKMAEQDAELERLRDKGATAHGYR